MTKTYLDIAKQDLRNSKALYELSNNVVNEMAINGACYFLQQAVELAIKYTLECNGVEALKTHTIETLIRYAEDNSVNLFLTDYIKEHAEMFSNWESNTRYIVDYLADKSKVETSLKEVEIYLENVDSKVIL